MPDEPRKPKLVTPKKVVPQGPLIRVAVVNDPVAYAEKTPAQERDEIVADLREHGLNTTLSAGATRFADLGTSSVDLLVFDYGAVWQRPDLIAREGGAVRRWADEHPGSIALLYSPFTARFYRRIVEDEFGVLDNVWYLFKGDDLYGREDETVYDRLRAWYDAL